MANTDIRKAAILLMSLPDDQAAQLLGKLAPKEVEAVSIEIARTSGISGEEQESVIQDFASANPTGLTGRSGGLDVRGRWSSGRWARGRAPPWTTSASRSRPSPSASCRRSTARTCSPSSSTSTRKPLR